MVQQTSHPASEQPGSASQASQQSQMDERRAEAPIIPTIATAEGLAYFQGRFTPMAEANVSVATHGLHYGTGCFEGIRAYWNADHQQLYVLKLREHFERFAHSRRMLMMKPVESVDELCGVTIELLRRQNIRSDAYIRPVAFKSSRTIKLTLSSLDDAVCIYAFPMGNYVDISAGLNVCVSSWRRVSGNAMPVRAKTTGAYINSSLAVDEAAANGFDEAIFLTQSGTVSEGSSCNIFVVKHGRISTTRAADDILEGITRDAAIGMLARDMGMTTEVRAIERTELYDADEIFFTGTGVQVSPVTRVDRRAIGDGRPGPITMELQRRYLRAVRGDDPAYSDWLTPVYQQ
ncbi:MAG TPA: branched-chain amino acid transaminase [Ktedonobacterales bacterium]|jgi:branched-chain amino acid aminotransferase|nr:branched-chain amino acid transaminase [Ktedonobacterales bacterium]